MKQYLDSGKDARSSNHLGLDDLSQAQKDRKEKNQIKLPS